MTALGDVTPGRVLNAKWTLGEHLGTGGAGSVYVATHRNGTRAAVKLLHPSLAADEEQVGRFLREGVIANHVGHPGVVAALDDDRTEDGLVYLVLELLEGASLAEHIEDHAPLGVDEALAIVDQVLDVLGTAHGKGIIHRDVKPANVFLLRDGSVKLLDFGIARTSAPSLGLAPPTQMGAIFGSPGFMPPEQAKGSQDLIDVRTDLWSVAALLFTMLTGTRLHAAATPNESLARAMFEPCPPIRSVAASLDETVAALVDRGLAFDRDDRFPSAERMQAAVRYARGRAVDASSPSPGRGAITVSSPLSSKVRATGMGAGAVLLVLFVVTVGWLARPEDRAPPSSRMADVASAIADDTRPSPALPPSEPSEPSAAAMSFAGEPPRPPASALNRTRAPVPRMVAPSQAARAQAPRGNQADPLGARR